MRVIDAAIARRAEEGLSPEGYVFCPHDKPLNTYTSIQKTFTKYCRELGILQRSSHKGRKTVVSTLLDKGVNINTVRQIIDHMDEKTTLNNYCYDRSDSQDRYDLITQALTLGDNNIIESESLPEANPAEDAADENCSQA